MREIFVVGNENAVWSKGDEDGFAGALGKDAGTLVEVAFSRGVNGFVAVGFEYDIFEVGDAGAGVGKADGVGMGFGEACEFGDDAICEYAAVGFLYLVEGYDAIYLGEEMAQGFDELIFEVEG